MVKTLYRLKSKVKKITFNNSLKPTHHKTISENKNFINAHLHLAGKKDK